MKAVFHLGESRAIGTAPALLASYAWCKKGILVLLKCSRHISNTKYFLYSFVNLLASTLQLKIEDKSNIWSYILDVLN